VEGGATGVGRRLMVAVVLGSSGELGEAKCPAPCGREEQGEIRPVRLREGDGDGDSKYRRQRNLPDPLSVIKVNVRDLELPGSKRMRIVKEPSREARGGHDPGLAPWVIAGLLAGAALVGLLVIFIVVFISLERPPPLWVEIAVGAGLVIGATLFAWLLASAFTSAQAVRSSRAARRDRPRAAGAPDDDARPYSEVS
jgi:hypothetical protein